MVRASWEGRGGEGMGAGWSLVLMNLMSFDFGKGWIAGKSWHGVINIGVLVVVSMG